MPPRGKQRFWSLCSCCKILHKLYWKQLVHYRSANTNVLLVGACKAKALLPIVILLLQPKNCLVKCRIICTYNNKICFGFHILTVYKYSQTRLFNKHITYIDYTVWTVVRNKNRSTLASKRFYKVILLWQNKIFLYLGYYNVMLTGNFCFTFIIVYIGWYTR